MFNVGVHLFHADLTLHFAEITEGYMTVSGNIELIRPDRPTLGNYIGNHPFEGVFPIHCGRYGTGFGYRWVTFRVDLFDHVQGHVSRWSHAGIILSFDRDGNVTIHVGMGRL